LCWCEIAQALFANGSALEACVGLFSSTEDIIGDEKPTY